MSRQLEIDVIANVAQAKRDLGSVDQSVQQLTQSTKAADEATQGQSRAALRMAEMQKKWNAETEEANKKFEAFEKRLGGVNVSTDKLLQSLEKMGGKIQSAGTQMTLLTAPMTAAGLVAGKFASDYETSTTKLETLSGVTAQNMATMRQGMLDLAPAVGIGPRALAEAMLVVTSTGIRGADAMNILTAAARASAVGLGDTKDIARAITSAVTAYGKENLSAARAAEILFKTVREGGAEADELAGTLGRVVGTAAQVGVSFDQVGTFLATFTRLGVDSAEAVTALRGTLSLLLKPSAGAREELEKIGFSIDDLRKAVKERGLTAALAELIDKTKGNDDSIAKIIPNVRALAGVLGTAARQGKDMADVQTTIAGTSNDLDAAFQRVQSTTSFTWKAMAAHAEAVAIAFGDRLAPSLKTIFDAAQPLLTALGFLVDLFASLPTPVQTVIIGLGALVVSIGPVMFAFGGIIKALAIIGPGFDLFVGLLPIVSSSFLALGGVLVDSVLWIFATALPAGIATLSGAFTTLLGWLTGTLVPFFTTTLPAALAAIGPAGWITIAVIAGLVAIYEAWKHWDEIVAFVKAVYDAVKMWLVDKFSAVVDYIGEKVHAVTGFFGEMYDKVVGHSYVPDMMRQIESSFGKLDSFMMAPVRKATEAVTKQFDAMGKSVTSSLNGMFSGGDGGGSGGFDVDKLTDESGKVVGGISSGAGGGIAKAAGGFNPSSMLSGIAGGLVAGGLSSLMGAGISALLKIGGPSKEELDGRKSLDAINKQLQGLATAQQQVEAGGRDWATQNIVVRDSYIKMGYSADQAVTLAADGLQAVYKASLKGPEAAAQAFQPLLDAINKAKQRTADFSAALGGVSTAVDAVHGVLTPALKETILQLSQMKGLTAEEQTALQDLANNAKPNFAELTDIAKGYGLSLQDLGPKFQQADLDGAASKLYGDFQMLTGAGADVGGVLHAMGGKINDLVNNAKEFGGTIPEAFRPLVQNLFDTGQLTDANGDKLKDLGGINFADTPLNTGMDNLAKTIDHLADVLNNLPGMAKKAADGVPANPFQDWAPPSGGPDYSDYGSTGGYVTASGIQNFSAGGRVLPFVARGTDTVPAMLTPGEGVLNTGAMKRLGARGLKALNSGGGMGNSVNVAFNGLVIEKSLDENEAGEVIKQAFVKEIRRRGIRFKAS